MRGKPQPAWADGAINMHSIFVRPKGLFGLLLHFRMSDGQFFPGFFVL